MINKDQSIACPICATAIPFDTQQLLKGYKFTCPNCSASVGIAQDSRHVVEATMKKLEVMKQQALAKKKA